MVVLGLYSFFIRYVFWCLFRLSWLGFGYYEDVWFLGVFIWVGDLGVSGFWEVGTGLGFFEVLRSLAGGCIFDFSSFL